MPDATPPIPNRWRIICRIATSVMLLDGVRLLYVAAALLLGNPGDDVSYIEPLFHLGFIAAFIIEALIARTGDYLASGGGFSLAVGALYVVMALGLFARLSWARVMTVRVFSVLLLLAPGAWIIYVTAWAPAMHRETRMGGTELLLLLHLLVFGTICWIFTRHMVKAYFAPPVPDGAFPALPPAAAFALSETEMADAPSPNEAGISPENG